MSAAHHQISDGELAEIKARNPCDQIAGKWVKLRRHGRKFIGPCPLHSPDPTARDSTSFECDAAGFVCAVCCEGGDVIKLVELRERIDFLAAVNWLGGVQRLDPAREAQLEQERKHKQAETEKSTNEFREKERGKVFDIWRAGAAIAGTSAAAYLALRLGNPPDLPPGIRLRCIEDMPYYASGAKDAEAIHRGPAMLAAIMRAGAFSGLHITYIDLNRPKGKLELRDSNSGELPSKKVRGSKTGGHIELNHPPSMKPTRLIIGEGIEKTLAVWRAISFAAATSFSASGAKTDTAFWTSIDLGNLGGKAKESVPHPTVKNAGGKSPQRVPGPEPDLDAPGIIIPDSVTEIIILGDTTSDRFATECAIARAAKRWGKHGRSVKVAWAWPGNDFDDVLRLLQPIEAAYARIVGAIETAQPVELTPVIEQPAPAEKIAVHTPRARKKASPATPDSTPESPAHPAESGGEPNKPKEFGFDVDDLNREWALVLMGSNSVLFREQPDAMIEDQKRIVKVEAFKQWYKNKKTQVGAGDRIKTITWANRWLEHPKRRQYHGVEFHPDVNNAPGTPGYLNMWSGLVVEVARERDDRKYKTFRDHLRNNICGGNEDYFKWVFGFFAHIVQRPRERLGTALVMRGKMGTGKTKVGEIIGRLFPRHYFLVDDPRYVTGQFNAHMAICLLLQADEAVWAGDKAAEGRLKGLITAPIQHIEAKGIDPIRLPNYVRLIMTSNEEWVVPAGKDERRFAVLDVHPRCAQNHEYFREMDEELANGGIEALLADLLAFDLSSVDLWRIPRTDALLEQKIRSLDSVESWWFQRLSSGSTSRNGQRWNQEIAITTLYADYIAISDKIGVRRKKEQTVFGITMARLLPGVLDRKKRTVDVEDDRGGMITRRVWCYLLPSLDVARDAFEQAVEQKVEWLIDDDQPDPIHHESRESIAF